MKLSSGQQESIVSLFKCVDENNIEVIKIGNRFVMHPFSNASCYEHRCLLLNSIVDRTSEMYAFSYNHVDIALYSFWEKPKVEYVFLATFVMCVVHLKVFWYLHFHFAYVGCSEFVRVSENRVYVTFVWVLRVNHFVV